MVGVKQFLLMSKQIHLLYQKIKKIFIMKKMLKVYHVNFKVFLQYLLDQI